MNMTSKIRDAVQQKTGIELKEKDFKGRGQFGEVYLHEIQNHSIAVKCFKDQDAIHAIQEAKTFEEIDSIVKDCPGILSYYGMKKLNIEIKKDIQMFNYNYQGNCLFMQACQKNLNEINKFPQNEFFNFLSQMSLSLFCLHQNKCSHNDLKPANILFNINDKQQLLYYLTDFGESKFLKMNIDTYCQNQSLKGTPFYFSPELLALYRNNIDQGEYNSLSADIFALGLICLQLLIGTEFVQRLNSYYNQPDKYNKEVDNIKAELLKLPEFQSNSQKKILDLLLKMISFDRKLRPQAIEICQKLIEAQLFKMDTLETNNMKALLYQLITTLNKNDMKSLISQLIQPQQNVQEESKAIIIPKNSNQISINPVQKEAITIPTFQSNILQNSTYSSLILSLFEDSDVNLQKIHSQSIAKKFNYKKFHLDCDNKGSTLLIFTSKEEPHSFFGGMAVSEWESPEKYYWAEDPADKSSWLFKIESEGKTAKLHQWKCFDKKHAINCDKSDGPLFGSSSGTEAFCTNYIIYEEWKKKYWGGLAYSYLPSNNDYYKKLDLNSQLKNENNLLYQLQKKISIDCPAKVIGEIMSEQSNQFQLSECEVFAIKK